MMMSFGKLVAYGSKILKALSLLDDDERLNRWSIIFS